ncbi:MAG: hypothetical protein KAS86_03580, partial [Candidatus Omnitrophica bacterium]|nr:hypothetical protein [Candidatus Omnitrophota bacterium]
MHKIRLKKYRIIRRSASVLLIMAFVVNFVLMDSWAVPVNPLRGPGPIQDSRFSVLDIETFSIPSYLGSVKYSSKGNSDKVVIHIQDAHSNYAAQNRIAEIIEYLHGEYGLEDINLEGGTGDYDLSVLTDIYDRDVRKRVADYFVKYGELNGAEFFALNNPDEVALWGVEDEDLYMENLNVYLDSLSYRDEVNAYLKELDFFLSNLKRHIFSGELMEFDMEYTRYKANDIDFKDYLSFILERAREKGVDIKMYTNIYLLGQAIEEEGGVDFKRANSQRDEIIAGLRNILSKNEMDRLMSKTIAFKSKRISQKEFYGYLLEKAGHAGQDMEAFPEFRKYIVYISLYDAADKFSIMREMEDLESRVKEALYQNDKQRELDRLSRNFILTRSMFELLFTKDDYRYYKENMPAFEVHNYISFIKKEAPLYGMTAKLDKDIAGLDAYRERIFEFYECSFKRDRAFLKNIRLAGAGDGPRAGILVTGGFHTENLLALLEEKDISYVSIIPGFRNEEGYRSPYFSVLSGGMSPLEKSIDSALSSIQVASLLNRLGIEAAGPERQEIFRIGVLALTSMEYDTEKRTKAVQLGLGEVREYVVVEMKDGEPALNKYRLSEKDFVRQFPDAEILVAAGVEEPGAAGMTWILSRVAEANIEKLPGERLKRDSPAVKAVRDLIRNLPRLEDTLEHILGTDGKYIEIKDGLRAPLVSGKAVYIPAMDEAGKRLSPSRQAVMIVHELVGGTFKGNMTRGYNNGHELASAVETALRAGHPVEAAEAMEGAELHPAGKTLWQMTDKEISQAEGMDFSGLIANAFVNVGVGVVAGIGDLAFNAGDKGVDYVIGALKGKTELQKEMAPFKKMYKTTGREMPDKIRAWLADTSPEKYEDLKKALTSANEARDLLEKTGLEPVTAAGLVLDFLAWRGRSVPPAPLMSDFHTLVRALEQAKLRPSAAESVLHSVLENRKIKAAWTLRSLADITANIRGYDDVRDLELENALKTIFRVVDDQFCQALLVLSVENITDDFRPVKTTILEKVRTERRNSEFFAHRYTSLSLLLALTRDYTERKKKEFEQGRSVFSFEGEGGETVEEVSGYLIGRLAELKEETLATQPVPAGTKLIEGESGDIRLRLMEDGDLLAKSMRDGKVMPLTIRGVKVKVKGRDLGKVEKSFIEFIKESGDYLITITTRDDVIRSINADKPEDKGWTEHVRWEEIVRQRNVRLKREKDRIEGKPAVKQG